MDFRKPLLTNVLSLVHFTGKVQLHWYFVFLILQTAFELYKESLKWFRENQEATWNRKRGANHVASPFWYRLPHPPSAETPTWRKLFFDSSPRLLVNSGSITQGDSKHGTESEFLIIPSFSERKLTLPGRSHFVFTVESKVRESAPHLEWMKFTDYVGVSYRYFQKSIIRTILVNTSFRYFTQKKATSYDLKGWVRNANNGNVCHHPIEGTRRA